jgi:hypothetical protein
MMILFPLLQEGSGCPRVYNCMLFSQTMEVCSSGSILRQQRGLPIMACQIGAPQLIKRPQLPLSINSNTGAYAHRAKDPANVL